MTGAELHTALLAACDGSVEAVRGICALPLYSPDHPSRRRYATSCAEVREVLVFAGISPRRGQVSAAAALTNELRDLRAARRAVQRRPTWAQIRTVEADERDKDLNRQYGREVAALLPQRAHATWVELRYPRRTADGVEQPRVDVDDYVDTWTAEVNTPDGRTLVSHDYHRVTYTVIVPTCWASDGAPISVYGRPRACPNGSRQAQEMLVLASQPTAPIRGHEAREATVIVRGRGIKIKGRHGETGVMVRTAHRWTYYGTRRAAACGLVVDGEVPSKRAAREAVREAADLAVAAGDLRDCRAHGGALYRAIIEAEDNAAVIEIARSVPRQLSECRRWVHLAIDSLRIAAGAEALQLIAWGQWSSNGPPLRLSAAQRRALRVASAVYASGYGSRERLRARHAGVDNLRSKWPEEVRAAGGYEAWAQAKRDEIVSRRLAEVAL